MKLDLAKGNVLESYKSDVSLKAARHPCLSTAPDAVVFRGLRQETWRRAKPFRSFGIAGTKVYPSALTTESSCKSVIPIWSDYDTLTRAILLESLVFWRMRNRESKPINLDLNNRIQAWRLWM